MVPFLEEFKSGVKILLGSVHKGSTVIIMGLDEPRALLCEVDGHEGNWTYGRIMFPKVRYPLPAMTFSRKIDDVCVELTPAEASEMIESYESMFVKYE
jgi:hypothetical protein